MKGTGSVRRLFVRRVILFILTLGVLSGCDGSLSEFDIATTVNVLGGGQHVTTLVIPVELEAQVFDRLPDVSLLTGVRVEDYRSSDGHGVRVTQTFSRLDRLNADPSRAYVLNKALPQTLVSFRARWSPGFLTRQLHIDAEIAPILGGGFFDATSFITRDLVDATFTLTLPGQIVRHNGSSPAKGVVVWKLDAYETQTLEATAEVLNLPMIFSLIFTLLSIVWLIVRLKSDSGGHRDMARPVGAKSPTPHMGPRGSSSRSSGPLPPPRRHQ